MKTNLKSLGAAAAQPPDGAWRHTLPGAVAGACIVPGPLAGLPPANPSAAARDPGRRHGASLRPRGPARGTPQWGREILARRPVWSEFGVRCGRR